MTKEREYRAYAGAGVDLGTKPPMMRTKNTFWLWPKRGSAWLIVFSDQFLNRRSWWHPALGQSLGG